MALIFRISSHDLHYEEERQRGRQPRGFVNGAWPPSDTYTP